MDLYVSEVGFDYLADAAEQHWFKNLGTNFSLPATTVDALDKVACRLLVIDPQFRLLLNGDAGFTGSRVTGTLPDCH